MSVLAVSTGKTHSNTSNRGDSERTRTSNLLIRSQMLYPLSYGANTLHFCFRGAKIVGCIPKNQTSVLIFFEFWYFSVLVF
jgi:hypothetical protein